jgi:hypothetical protein
MCITDSTSRESLQSFIGAGALSLLHHSVAAHFYAAPAASEPRDQAPKSPVLSPVHAEPASSRRESLGATAPGGSARLPDSLVQAILLGLQHIATIRDGQQLLLENSIESVLADFFLGHGFSQGARGRSFSSSLRAHSRPSSESLPSNFTPSIINQRSPAHTLSMCKLLSSLLPPIDVRRLPGHPIAFCSVQNQFIRIHSRIQGVLRDALMPIVVTSGEKDISAIFTSTSSEGVPPEQRRELLKLLPALICSACAAGSASSNTRYRPSFLMFCLFCSRTIFANVILSEVSRV